MGQTWMMLPAALHGWIPSIGQWCTFAMSWPRGGRATYAFRAHVESLQAIAVRLELIDRLAREFRRRHDGDIVFLPGAKDGLHPGSPLAVPQDVVVEDQGPDVRRPKDALQMGQGPLRVLGRIVVRHVRHRA